MRIDPKQVGRNIQAARIECGFTSADKLSAALRALIRNKVTDNRQEGSKLGRQTVRNWETGKIFPPWLQLQLLCRVFEQPEIKKRPQYNGPYDEERLLFGKRREGQLKGERHHLVRVSDQELVLLTAFLDTNPHGQEMIIKHARMAAETNPVAEAVVHPFRRKEDRSD